MEFVRIFEQLDEILKGQGVERTAVASARLYLERFNEDIAAAIEVYASYFGVHQPSRRA